MADESTTVGGYDASDFQWETVHEEAPDQLIFDIIGDEYIGEYIGHELIYPEGEGTPEKWFIQLRWRDHEGIKVTNAGYELQTTYVEVHTDDNGHVVSTKDIIPPHTMTRTTLAKLVDIGQPSKMKSFRVDTAKNRAGNKG